MSIDLIGDEDHYGEMAEIALWHEVGSDVDRAYRRTDMVEKRRQMMADGALCYYLD